MSAHETRVRRGDNRPPTEPRSRTISRRRPLRAEDRVEYPADVERPRTRGDCDLVPRPCPWVSCKYSLYIDVSEAGGLKLNHPTRDPDELHPEESCALDVAERGGVMLAEVGRLLNVVRERARQIEARALDNLKAAGVELAKP